MKERKDNRCEKLARFSFHAQQKEPFLIDFWAGRFIWWALALCLLVIENSVGTCSGCTGYFDFGHALVHPMDFNEKSDNFYMDLASNGIFSFKCKRDEKKKNINFCLLQTCNSFFQLLKLSYPTRKKKKKTI